MRQFIRLFGIVLGLALSVVSSTVADELVTRTWTSRSGTQLDAKFIQRTGDSVVLEKSDGSRVTIRLPMLGPDDQEYVRGLATAPATTPGSEVAAEVGEWKPGEISEEIKCQDDPEWSYYLYLPKSFDLKRTWPVLYIMMPSGGNTDALQRYITGAELCGWILAISVQSSNGFDGSNDAVLAMVDDVQKRLPIDEKRRYASGDSGGARMSFWLCSKRKDPPFAGIIPVIAGGREEGKVLSNNTTIYGLDGSNDYNRYDMAEAYHENKNRRSRLRYVPGEHGGDFGDCTTDAMIWLNSCYLLNLPADADPRLGREYQAFSERIRGDIERMKDVNPDRAYEWALALTQSENLSPASQPAKALLQSLLTIPRVKLYAEGLVDLEKFVKKHFAQTISHSSFNYSTPAEKKDAGPLAEKYKDTSLGEIFRRLGEPTVGK